MTEKKMTLKKMVRWLDNNGSPHKIDDEGRLTVKDDLWETFTVWVRTRKYTSLPDELFCVEGDLWLCETPITSLGNLTSVGGDLDLEKTPIASLDNLTSVGGFLDLGKAPITSLGNLTSVGKDVNLRGTPVTSLDNLTSVGDWLDLGGTPVTSLGNLTSVGGDLDLQGTPIASLGNLTHVGGDLDLWGTSVTSLGDLPQIDGNLFLSQNQLHLLTREALRKAGGKILYRESSGSNWIPLSPSELETIIAENEARDSLRNTRKTGVDWDLYDR